MQLRASRIASLRDAFSAPPFFGDPVVSVSRFLATSLLHVARVPHKYALSHTASGTAPHLRTFRNHPELGPLARGDGIDLASASLSMTRCLFELLERVWSPNVNVARLPYKSRSDLADEALDPRRFALLSDEEYEATKRHIRYTDDLKLHWTECWRLAATGMLEPALVPAVLVYPGFGIRCPEERFVPMLSTGIAAGTRYDEALLRGLCEVVERDAFAITWLRHGAPPRVPTKASCLGPGARSVVDDLEADRFEVSLFDLTLDIAIPVAMAAITDRRKDELPQTVLGLGCSPWPTQALEKALAEALQQMTNRYEFPGGTDVVSKAVERALPAAEESARSQALAAFLGSGAMSSRFDGPAREPDPARTPEMLIASLAEIERHGFSAHFCDLTPPELGDGDRFCLVRVLVPGLQPHLYESDCWRLASGRLHEPPEKLGLTPRGEPGINRVVNPLIWDFLR
jgi:ribosomal protein S12 methylthiotransferase accessory factor